MKSLETIQKAYLIDGNNGYAYDGYWLLTTEQDEQKVRNRI